MQLIKADAVAAVAVTWRRTHRRLHTATDTIRQLSIVDDLTGLANRRGLLAHGHTACEHARITRSPVAVGFIDLDGLKAINDNRGHGAGDQILADAAHQIATSIGHDGFVARLGGDEFVVVLSGPAALTTGDRLTALQNQLHHNGIAVSVGHTLADMTSTATTFNELLDQADHAMLDNKQHRRPT